MKSVRACVSAALVLSMGACGHTATQSIAAGSGLHPSLPPPQKSLIPNVRIAPATGWPAGITPTPAAGANVNAFAIGLDHPRWLYVLPNGDVLVAQSNAPPRPDDAPGIKGWIMKLVMKKAGAAPPSADRITLLRDTDGDGVADVYSTLLEGLHSPFGMELVGDELFVANTDSILRFSYHTGDTDITTPGTEVIALPAGPINHHWTKNIIASADGTKLYVTIGSNSNVGERGMAAETERAAIWEVHINSGTRRLFASGLRNPNGLAWEPVSGALWTVVNERDELGSDLVPDYMTALRDGGFYGWPYSYFGQHVDDRVKPPRPDRVADAIVPDYALGPHTGSLGLAYSAIGGMPAPFANGMFIGQHGSWNRQPQSGYKVIFVPFRNGKPVDSVPLEVLTGFLSADGDAYGRPVGVAVDRSGALLVADDVGNVIWRVSASPAPASSPVAEPRAQE